MEKTSHDATRSVAPGATNRQHNKKWEKWEEEGSINSPPPSIYAISTVFCEAHGTPVHMCDGQYRSRPPPDYGKLSELIDPSSSHFTDFLLCWQLVAPGATDPVAS